MGWHDVARVLRCNRNSWYVTEVGIVCSGVAKKQNKREHDLSIQKVPCGLEFSWILDGEQCRVLCRKRFQISPYIIVEETRRSAFGRVFSSNRRNMSSDLGLVVEKLSKRLVKLYSDGWAEWNTGDIVKVSLYMCLERLRWACYPK